MCRSLRLNEIFIQNQQTALLKSFTIKANILFSALNSHLWQSCRSLTLGKLIYFRSGNLNRMQPCLTGKSACRWLLLSLATGLSGNSKSFIHVSSWLNQCLCMMYLWIANTCCLQAKQCFYLFAYFWFFNHCMECCESHLVTIICC